jgi:hypothetical protein
MIPIRKQLQDAQDAYHNLMLGKAPKVIVDQNGERVEYNTANSAKLQQYIQQLESKLGLNANQVRGPMTVYF